MSDLVPVSVKWSGTTLRFSVPSNATVRQLKEELFVRTGVPLAGQKLAGSLALTKAKDDDLLFAVKGVESGLSP